MRRGVLAVLVLVVVVAAAGCGGGSGGDHKKKKTPTMSRAQYVAVLNQLCSSGNSQAAALKLTTSLETWKQNGQKAVRIVKQTIKAFEELTPPAQLKRVAEQYVKANKDLEAAVQDAADAARAGNVKQFDRAISQQQGAISLAQSAASRIGAEQCS